MNFSEWLVLNEVVRHKSVGFLRYRKPPNVIVEIDKEIANYYRSLIPKYINYNLPAHIPHITVVRTGKEEVKNMDNWGKWEGKKIPFEYENYINSDNTYFWLKAYSDTIGEVREMLGLPKLRSGFSEYHITIANKKNA